MDLAAMKEQWKHARDYAKARNDYYRKESPRRLFHAVEQGDLDVMSEALRDGADVNGIYREWNDITPLMWAAECGEARSANWLLDHGADVDHQGGEGNRMNTALHKACSMGHEKVVGVLLDVGQASTELANSNGKTAVETALDFIAKHEARAGNFTDNRVYWARRCVDKIEQWEAAKRSVPPLCLPSATYSVASATAGPSAQPAAPSESSKSSRESNRSRASSVKSSAHAEEEAGRPRRDTALYSMSALLEDDDD